MNAEKFQNLTYMWCNVTLQLNVGNVRLSIVVAMINECSHLKSKAINSGWQGFDCYDANLRQA